MKFLWSLSARMHRVHLKALLNKTLKITGELQSGEVLNPGLQAGVQEHFGVIRMAAAHPGALHLWLQPVLTLGRISR